MNLWGSNSLRIRLTWRIVVMQALVLIAFTAIAAVPIYRFLSEELRYETDIIDDIASAIVVGEDGRWQLVMGDDLAEDATDYPDLWFYALDANGHSLQWGEIPDRLLTMVDALKSVRSANISGLGPNEDLVALLRRHEGAMGRIWIVVGNGPEIGIRSAFGNPGYSTTPAFGSSSYSTTPFRFGSNHCASLTLANLMLNHQAIALALLGFRCSTK